MSKKATEEVNANPYQIKGVDVTKACIGVMSELVRTSELNGGKGREFEKLARGKAVTQYCKGVARSNRDPEVSTLKNLLVVGFGMATMKAEKVSEVDKDTGEPVLVTKWVPPSDKVAWVEVLDLLEDKGKIKKVGRMTYLPGDAPDDAKAKEKKMKAAAKTQIKAAQEFADKGAALL